MIILQIKYNTGYNKRSGQNIGNFLINWAHFHVFVKLVALGNQSLVFFWITFSKFLPLFDIDGLEVSTKG